MHAADKTVYTDSSALRLDVIGPIALFSEFKWTTTNFKSIESMDNPHVVFLMYKLITSSLSKNDLSNGFETNRTRRQEDLVNRAGISQPKNIGGKFHLKIYLKEGYVFAEHQENVTYVLGYRKTLKRKTDNNAVDRAAATTNADLLIRGFIWFVPHYTPNKTQQRI